MFGPGVRTGRISDLGGPTMGTSWSARIVDAPPGSAAAIEAVLSRIIAQMSNWEADSAISRFNAAPVGQWMPLPAHMPAVLRAGLDLARLSASPFDPAVGRRGAEGGLGPGGG